MMKPIFRVSVLALVLMPLFAHAESFKEIVNSKILPLADGVIQLMYALAFIFFLVGVVRFMMTKSEEERTEGKKFMLWGVIAFVVLFGVWGFVKLFLSVLPTGAA
jgi:uncharacterized membrane protein YjfL (UPF0719 family)